MCPELFSPDNGLVTFTSRRPGSGATYTCDSGYIINGNERRVCQPDGSWSNSEPTCSRMSQYNIRLARAYQPARNMGGGGGWIINYVRLKLAIRPLNGFREEYNVLHNL